MCRNDCTESAYYKHKAPNNIAYIRTGDEKVFPIQGRYVAFRETKRNKPMMGWQDPPDRGKQVIAYWTQDETQDHQTHHHQPQKQSFPW